MRDEQDRLGRLVTLNKLEVLLGLVIAIMTIANGVGAWYVLPYRLSAAENDVRAVSDRLDKYVKEGESKTELLIRIDERLREMQGQLNRVQGQLNVLQDQRR